MVGKVGKAKIAAIEEIGEDEVLERISTGTSVRTLMKEFNVGYKLFAMWLDAVGGRRGRYEQALNEAVTIMLSVQLTQLRMLSLKMLMCRD